MTMTATPTWVSEDHPRGEGQKFVDKVQHAPEISLDAEETVFTKRYESVKEKIAAFHDELETRVADLADDENWQNYLHTMGAFHRYSFLNQILIQSQRPDATRVASFRKWKELDRSVMKGEKGISILRPAFAKTEEKDANGKPAIGPDGKPIVGRKIIGFSTASVFDVAQTEGKPLPTAHEELTEDPPAGFIENLEASIRSLGFTVSYEKIPGAARGFTEPGRVVVDESLNPAERARTLAHEHGHVSLGHLDRIDEYHQGHDGKRGAMEVEAESFAYVVCRSQGMSPLVGGTSATYVAGWQGADTETVRRSAEAVSKAVKGVLGSEIFAEAEEADEPAAAA